MQSAEAERHGSTMVRVSWLAAVLLICALPVRFPWPQCTTDDCLAALHRLDRPLWRPCDRCPNFDVCAACCAPWCHCYKLRLPAVNTARRLDSNPPSTMRSAASLPLCPRTRRCWCVCAFIRDCVCKLARSALLRLLVAEAVLLRLLCCWLCY